MPLSNNSNTRFNSYTFEDNLSMLVPEWQTILDFAAAKGDRNDGLDN